MTALQDTFKSFLRSSWPRIFWCAVLLFWSSSSACDIASFQGLSPDTRAEFRRNIQADAADASNIILGQMERVTSIKGVLEHGLQVYRLRFKVERSWVGRAQPGTFVNLRILEPSSTCDFFPRVKESWFVWVKRGTREMSFRSIPVNAKRWTDASLSAVLEAIVTQTEP